MTRSRKPSGGLPVAWTKHLKDPKKKKELEDTLRNATTALYRLRDVLEEKAEVEKLNDISIDTYDNPSWAYKQAHSNGMQAGIKYTLDLLNFLPGKIN